MLLFWAFIHFLKPSLQFLTKTESKGPRQGSQSKTWRTWRSRPFAFRCYVFVSFGISTENCWYGCWGFSFQVLMDSQLYRDATHTHLKSIQSPSQTCVHYAPQRHSVGLWSAALIGSEAVISHSPFFPGLKCLGRGGGRKSLCEWDKWEEWRAPLLGHFPTAETGYDTLNLTLECYNNGRVFVCLRPPMCVLFST